MNIISPTKDVRDAPVALIAIDSKETLTRVRAGKNQSDGLAKCHSTGQISVPVVKVPERATATLASTLLDTFERRNKVGKNSSSMRRPSVLELGNNSKHSESQHTQIPTLMLECHRYQSRIKIRSDQNFPDPHHSRSI
jgi:hypothetical protein